MKVFRLNEKYIFSTAEKGLIIRGELVYNLITSKEEVNIRKEFVNYGNL